MAMARPHILVIEDDPLLRRHIENGLSEAGYLPWGVPSAEAAIAACRTQQFDAMVIDRGLPAMDGLSALRALRAQGVTSPAMFLSARADVEDRVDGLNAGSDDYLAKPFALKELVARVRALLRRPRAMAPEMVRVGRLSLDVRAHEVRVDDIPVALTAQDVAIVSIFLRAADRTFSRDVLLDRLEAGTEVQPSAIDHAISRLRRKLGAAGLDPSITTVRGMGYRLAIHRGD
jgi:DNA-binding response OmpR family regulator